jgi:hypothetical protein
MTGPASQAGTIAASSRPLRRISRRDKPPCGVIAWWLVYGTWMAHDECGSVPEPFTLGDMVSGLCFPMELLVSAGVFSDHLNVENDMTKTFACAVIGISLLVISAPADAKGCIKGALVGGVAGHFAGHGALGAAAGCAIGHHDANKPSNPQPSTTGSAPQSAPK